MGRDWKQWAEDKGLRKWFRRDNFLILVLTGILLVIIALPTSDGKGVSGGKETGEGKGGNEEGGTGGELAKWLSLPAGTDGNGPDPEDMEETQEVQAAADEDALYADGLEERLTRALAGMAGVGKVRVMITLKASRELVVEKEQPVRRSATNESDSLGGNRSVSEVDSEESTVYRTKGDVSEPYVVKSLPPRIEGVLVVAQGAGQGAVSRTIVEIAQALFDVEAHKVKVVPMAQEGTP